MKDYTYDSKRQIFTRIFQEYKKGAWINTEDTGTDMLECPKCECRVITSSYLRAVGTKGMRFCPYCGADNSEEQGQTNIFEFMEEK